MFEEIEQSELGTLEYWETRYKTDIRNYKSHGDVGDVWFGDDIVSRIIKWMNKNVTVNTTDLVLDAGCGNGMLLVELYNEGYKNLVGVDYSENAVILAGEIAEKYECNVQFIVIDILRLCLKQNLFDVILDKGTYDAISLTSNASSNMKIYINNMFNTLKDGGLLIITSCNWTASELCKQFEHAFSFFECIPTPQFKFGGIVGNVVTSIIFKKKCIFNVKDK